MTYEQLQGRQARADRLTNLGLDTLYRTNPFVHRALERWVFGEHTLDEALAACILALASNQQMLEDNIEKVLAACPPYWRPHED